MHYYVFGEGEDVIFLHGWGADASAFLYFAGKLSNKFRVTVIDFAGFGKSSVPSRPFSVGDYAADVLFLMDKIGIKSANIVGHSFGGRVGIELAAKHKDRVLSLSLVDSAGIKPRRGLRYLIKVAVHKLLRKLGLKGLKGSSDYSKLQGNMRETFKKVVNYDQTPLLESIECKTAIFWGNKDNETPLYMAKKFNKLIKDSHIFMLQGGHFAYAEDPRTFLSILQAFLS